MLGSVRARRLALVGAIVWSRAAFAEPTTPFDEGKLLLQAGKAAEACVKFEAALRDRPEAPGILLNLGLCNAQQNKIATALKWFRKAQTLAAERQMAETENAAKVQTVALAAKVPTIKIEIAEPAPNDATVSVDGATIDTTSLAHLEIDAGRHVIELHGSGLAPTRETIEVPDHATPDTVVTLHVVVAPRQEPRTIVVEIDRGRSWRRASYILGATGAGLLAAETGLGLVGRKMFDDSHSLETRQRWKNIVRYGGTSMFALGVVAVGTGIGLFVRAPGKEHVERTVIVPSVGSGQLGVAISGTL
jgi:hypothetical protein